MLRVKLVFTYVWSFVQFSNILVTFIHCYPEDTKSDAKYCSCKEYKLM